MPENNLVEHPVPGALSIACARRCMPRLAYPPWTREIGSIHRLSARFALHAMQMGNTAKHILTVTALSFSFRNKPQHLLIGPQECFHSVSTGATIGRLP